MRNKDYFKHKKITIVGLARSGLASANLLYDSGARVSITEKQDNDAIRLNAEKLKLKNINLELGRHTPEFIRGRDLIVVSPGVPLEALPLVWAREFNVPVISEIEVASILCPATVIAVTGTNGKTTVTTLIGKILEADGRKAFICGNIGSPFSGDLDKMTESDFVSLEVSSFQLETIQTFKPKISVILNFSLNHLDRYKNAGEYLKAKKRIFMNQDRSDYLVLNSQDQVVKELADESKARVVFFCATENLNPNQAAVLSVGSILGVKEKSVLRVFSEFTGIEHRLEHVTEINNIEFINDSKSTTVDSTLWALKNISRPIVLIVGGRDKGNDYSILLGIAKEKVREFIIIGEAKRKIKNALTCVLPISEAETLEEAVKIAFHSAQSGDCILFSPMCSSFDMFSDYEQRGKVFKKAVYDLNNTALKNTLADP